jgi:hypothetical protein
VLTLKASAEPMLLAEFTWRQPYTVTLPAPYSVSVERAHNVRAGEGLAVTAFPFQYDYTQSEVDELNNVMAVDSPFRLLMWNGGNDGAHVVGGGPAACPACMSWQFFGPDAGPWQDEVAALGWDIDLHVPLEQPNFFGYWITAAEQLITAEGQTLRLFGAPVLVPEPATWLIVLCFLCVHVRAPALR